MTIVQLEYLLEVANHGSFSAAAECCFVTQSALSTQIAHLESELGVVLLDRNSKPIVPTKAGRVVIEQARKAISAFHRTKERVKDMKGDVSGEVRLAAIPTITPFLAPGFIARFVKSYPNVKLSFRDLYTADLVDAVERNVVDVAILSGGKTPRNIDERGLFDDKLYLYVSRGDKLFSRKSVSLGDIDISRLLVISEGNYLCDEIAALWSARMELFSQVDFSNNSLETMMNTVDRIGGVSIIPGMAIGHISEERRDQIRPFTDFDAHRKIIMAVANGFVKETLVEAIVRTIREVAEEEFAMSEFLLQ